MNSAARAACSLLVGLMLVSCGKEAPAQFGMTLHPETLWPVAPGQPVHLLLTLADEGQGRGEGASVAVTATATNATVVVEPSEVTPGEVAEVIVTPAEPPAGAETGSVTVSVSGEREGLASDAERTLEVWPGGDEWPVETATMVRDLFLPWLIENRPDLGLEDEQWEPVLVRPHILVVSYYLFFTDEWEMGVRWHVTIPPHNWAELYLRRRGEEVEPSLWFKIDSWTEPATPYETDLDETVWR